MSWLILRLVNQKIDGYDSLVYLADLLDHEFQTLSGFIDLGTHMHIKSNMKRSASSTLRHVC
jgi:hypothetical protein